jgi:hypothetical protein
VARVEARDGPVEIGDGANAGASSTGASGTGASKAGASLTTIGSGSGSGSGSGTDALSEDSISSREMRTVRSGSSASLAGSSV